ncbi:hypothetical protein TPHA_0C04120 [Tetrapisispora phaffii CBS 4417]|uniref:Cytochrome b-c1 complex subunit 10 n=1 Tax=Tetrapisispora phaffii (strain ATCC 24235 / CBS 4417 / NBRC 1672 / NRRL Y-8282 / UCD 70-5) TaxID=1071381 RepID=G8BQQ0_TETPH|nr:hypothetical protein TPHA_0C04120 [Tetrapisispora phaffii CBS 4417]CCE62562.1 hypothetical protein TPHA_0C04120 [Tetrapisispora phaffii CBS 4417]
MINYISKAAFKKSPHFGRLSFGNLINYSPNLLLWGGAWAASIAVFTEGWPLFQDAFYKKIPYFGQHWIVEIPPEDKQH